MNVRAVALCVLLLAAPVLAGCVNNAPETPAAVPVVAPPPSMNVTREGVLHGSSASPVNASLPAAMPRALGGEFLLGFDASEPSIASDKDGNVYMTAFASLGAPIASPTIVATFDHGKSFKDVGPKGANGAPHPISNDQIVHVDRDTGRVFMDDILPLSCGTLSFSDDKGASWLTNPYSCGNSNVNDHQTIGTAKPRTLPTVGYPNVVYRCTNNGAFSGCARSLTGGLSFLPQTYPYEPGYECGGLTSHVQSGPDGTVYLAKADCPSGPTIAYSKDDGTTWQKIVIKTDQGATDAADDHEMGFAAGKNHDMYALWEHKGQLWFSASVDDGKTWFPARNVTAPGVTATMFNTLAMGDDGKIAFAYVGSTVPGGYAGKGAGNPGLNGDLFGQPSLPEWDNATWNAYLGVILNATDPNAPIQSVTANDPSDPIARGLCGRTRCHGMNDFIEITIDNEGRPWASFVDTCTQKCVTDPKVLSDVTVGMMATLLQGPALRGGNLTLPVLDPQAPPKPAAGGATDDAGTSLVAVPVEALRR
jgi:hypothetical protein